MSVLVVGSFNLDRVFALERLPRPGETLPALYREGPGGKGFNQAVAAARLGAEVALLAAIGRDAAGTEARRLATAEGIAARWVEGTRPTGTAGILLDAEGRNLIAVAAGANLELRAEDVAAALEARPPPRVLLTQLEIPPAAVHAALARGRALGALTILDPAPVVAGLAPELLAAAAILKPNAEELGALLRALGETAPDPGELPSLDDEALHALCRRLAPGTVLLTLGAEGVFVSHGEMRHGDAIPCYRQPAAAAPRVVDTVGAGDAFAGALAAFLDLRPGRPLAEAVAFAQRAAALKIGREGAASAMPRREELAPG